MFLVINLYYHKIISCSSWKILLIYCTLFRDYMLSKKNKKQQQLKQTIKMAVTIVDIISDFFSSLLEEENLY